MADIGYLRRGGLELIFCKHSAISYPLHNHISVLALGFLLEGTIELVTEQGRGLYRKSDVFLIPPYAPHRINAMSRYTLLSLCVGTAWADAAGIEELHAAASFLHEALRCPELEAHIHRALRDALAIRRTLPPRGETAVSRLKTLLELHPEQRCSIDDMSRIVFLSKYHLIRAFKSEAGLTPHRFQLQNRVRKAQRLLEGPATITEAALAAGFCDQSHFTRQFEKLVGLTPTDYRLACRVTMPLAMDGSPSHPHR